MARPQRNTVDYFPHYLPGKGMGYVDMKHGNDGYAVWYRLLESLAASDCHFIDFRVRTTQLYFSAKCRLDLTKINEILADIAEVGGIDSELWSMGVIWSQKFSDSVEDAYRKRNNPISTRNDICNICGITSALKSENNTLTPDSSAVNPENSAVNTQRREEKSKEKNTKLNNVDAMQNEPKPKEVFTPENSFEKIHLGITEHHQPTGTNIADYVPAYEAWRDRSLVDTLFQSTYTMKFNTTVPEIKRLLNDFHHHIIATDKFHQTMSGWKRHFVSWLEIKRNAGEMKQIFKMNLSNGE
jgi:hypothetical protein